MASFFDFVKAPKLERFNYDYSSEVKFSGMVGDLIPFEWYYGSPGDIIKARSQVFLRLAPLTHPIFQKFNVDVHHFFIPLRLIWDDFESFITGFDQKTGHPTNDVNMPKIILSGENISVDNLRTLIKRDGLAMPTGRGLFASSQLADYLGIPVGEFNSAFGGLDQPEPSNSIYQAQELAFTCLPFRAYQRVFNDYYRDSIKEAEVGYSKDSNNLVIDNSNYSSLELNDLMTIRQRALGKDYFTSSQPTPQLGEDVSLPSPMVQTPVRMNGQTTSFSGNVTAGASGLPYLINNTKPMAITGKDDKYTLSDGALFTINKLRELFSVQKWKDAGNKFGARYKEQVLGHFGVETPDARLQRAEYLSGGRFPVLINQVSQLSASTEDSPLGYQAGQGMASDDDNFFEYECREHGIFMSIISIVPENTYFRGMPKKFLVKDKFDFPFPEFALLGEQEVSAKELNIGHSLDTTFGYQERYAEYKTNLNRAHGEFATTLRNFFVASPQIGSSCLDESELRVYPDNYDNVFAVEANNVDNVYFLVQNDIQKLSPLPYVNRIVTDYA